MIATYQDSAIHIAYHGNDRIRRIYRHNIAKKYDSMTTVAEHLRNWIGDVVVEQKMQPRRPDASFSWLCALVAVRVKLLKRCPLGLAAGNLE